MSNTRESALASVRSDPILKKQMSTINADLDAVAEKGHDTMSRPQRLDGGIVGLLDLRYGSSSCHWSTPPTVVRACRLLLTVGRPVVSQNTE
jgi:hypothetical protein